MESKVNDEFMRNILIEEAWKNLSGSFEWSEALLEKHQKNLDWDEISSNSNIRWTIPMIKKFANKIDWSKFSSDADEKILTPEAIEAFKDKWDWHELSGNANVPFTYELLEKYADLWDWHEVIDIWNNSLYEDKGIDFYEKFQEYIPASKLQSSRLWREMIEQQEKMLVRDIIA